MARDIILVKADFSAFIKPYTIHKVLKNNNRFNLGVESIRMSIEDSREICHFIYLHDIQIGGVILGNNRIKHLFLYPEYKKLVTPVIKTLHSKALEDMDSKKGISSLPSNAQQAAIFEKLGYKTIRKLRCVIGPIKKVSWGAPAGFIFRNPSKNDSELIIKLFYDANITEPWHQPVTMEQFGWGNSLYFNKNKTNSITKASTICFEEKTRKPVGACLISTDEGYPFVFDLHVLQDYRRKGIASEMMKKAFSKMSDEHDYMRLFMVDGNPAELLYEKLGFIAGKPVFIMKYLPGS